MRHANMIMFIALIILLLWLSPVTLLVLLLIVLPMALTSRRSPATIDTIKPDAQTK